MPEISVRGLEMPESPIRKLAPLAVAAKKRGTKVYHLNIGQPDLPTPQVGLDALKQIDREILEYSPSQGYQSYREKLVDYYAKYNINVTADDIIIRIAAKKNFACFITLFILLIFISLISISRAKIVVLSVASKKLSTTSWDFFDDFLKILISQLSILNYYLYLCPQ